MADEPEGRMDVEHQLYANFMAVNGGAFDVTLDFGFRVGEAVPDHATRIVMSWEHVSVMVKILDRMLDDYSSKAGGVRDFVDNQALIQAVEAESDETGTGT